MGHPAAAWALMGGCEAASQARLGRCAPLLLLDTDGGGGALAHDALRRGLLAATREDWDEDHGDDTDSEFDSNEDDELREGPQWEGARATASALALLQAASCSGSPWLLLGVANRMRRWLAAT